jgi:adenosylcobinamide kinase/adenosylcobinamide-phosphate guanylyltransferase
LTDVVKEYDVIIIDCLTLWVSNVLHTQSDVFDAVDLLARAVSQESAAKVYIVSNEVGLGIVPDSELARTYRDCLGYANRRIAEVAQNVYFMAAGIPLQIKGEMNDKL